MALGRARIVDMKADTIGDNNEMDDAADIPAIDFAIGHGENRATVRGAQCVVDAIAYNIDDLALCGRTWIYKLAHLESAAFNVLTRRRPFQNMRERFSADHTKTDRRLVIGKRTRRPGYKRREAIKEGCLDLFLSGLRPWLRQNSKRRDERNSNNGGKAPHWSRPPACADKKRPWRLAGRQRGIDEFDMPLVKQVIAPHG
jgi:hypothetical protein